MVKTESCKDNEASGPQGKGRRVFLTWLSAAVASICRTSWPTIASTAIPTPRYIPEGYSFVGEYRGAARQEWPTGACLKWPTLGTRLRIDFVN